MLQRYLDGRNVFVDGRWTWERVQEPKQVGLPLYASASW